MKARCVISLPIERNMVMRTCGLSVFTDYLSRIRGIFRSQPGTSQGVVEPDIAFVNASGFIFWYICIYFWTLEDK